MAFCKGLGTAKGNFNGTWEEASAYNTHVSFPMCHCPIKAVGSIQTGLVEKCPRALPCLGIPSLGTAEQAHLVAFPNRPDRMPALPNGRTELLGLPA